MRVQREHLTVLLNRLHDRGEERFAVEHPSSEIGELLEIELGEGDVCTVRFTKGRDGYAEARNEVGRRYPEEVYDDLPDPDNYLKTVLASGIIDPANRDDLKSFLDRYGDPDLMAGHPPVFAGFDTNIIPWRIDRLLGLREPDKGIGFVNGFVLATGVRDELDWDYKCHDTATFVAAFGDPFEEYWNQPLGAVRVGRLGMVTYRAIRDIEQGAEVQSAKGDEAIINAYDEYNREGRGDIVLFSNDRNFVERARAHRVLAEVVELPRDLPDETQATWREVELLLYLLAVVFGVVDVPSVTIHGVWRGKEGLDWQHERVDLDARSPVVEDQLVGDLSIVETYEDLGGE